MKYSLDMFRQVCHENSLKTRSLRSYYRNYWPENPLSAQPTMSFYTFCSLFRTFALSLLLSCVLLTCLHFQIYISNLVGFQICAPSHSHSPMLYKLIKPNTLHPTSLWSPMTPIISKLQVIQKCVFNGEKSMETLIIPAFRVVSKSRERGRYVFNFLNSHTFDWTGVHRASRWPSLGRSSLACFPFLCLGASGRSSSPESAELWRRSDWRWKVQKKTMPRENRRGEWQRYCS